MEWRKWTNIAAIVLSGCLSLALICVLVGRFIASENGVLEEPILAAESAAEMPVHEAKKEELPPATTVPVPEVTQPPTEPPQPQTTPTTPPLPTTPGASVVQTIPAIRNGSESEEWHYIPREETEATMQSSSDGYVYAEEPDHDYPSEALHYDDGTIYNPVPRYNQLDYGNEPYGTGTVASSGCALTSLAMVATYLRGEEILPNELARQYRSADGSHLQRMEAASIVMDLNYTKTQYFYYVLQALKEGKVVIILQNSKATFTSSQHFLVLTGMTADGKILVNDALGSNYNRPELSDGYLNGFDQAEIMRGFAGAWIYDFYEPPQLGPTNYPGLELTSEERDLLAKLIWREARGESFEGQQAVAEVVFNRMMSDRFETSTVSGTIMAEGQFRTRKFLNNTTADLLQYKAIDRALSGPNVLPTDVFYFATKETNNNVWGRIGKHVFCRAE